MGCAHRNASIPTGVMEGQARASVQVNYGMLLTEGRAGRVGFEVPVMGAPGVDGEVDDTVTGHLGGVLFVTQGCGSE